ncbi:DUF1194 domain-containing protein [Oceanibacterium hippocampi]|uniref:von Willebrand factor type A domain protein n=1 Tax=Oceanibacterium hippocampi TaxID=745714 RepID=A0A1Y5S8B6_9PROT|nr:DUF1194 domain-containing protein [Oceanibacterium hippocampi]SLN34635.1 von Willebrand factor type A domain protein [Oceanibacterium hippocampi]
MRIGNKVWHVLAAALGLLGPAVSGAAARAEPVDVELVLAVDVSSSVDWTEFGLQMRGIAAAFREPDLHATLREGRHGAIAVVLVQWAGPAMQQVVVDWQRIGDAAAAERFANAIDATSRSFPTGGTAIAEALDFVAPLFDGNGFEGDRRVVDISGDGRATAGTAPGAARDRIVARGVTVNGLAILNDEPDLVDYYEGELIGGQAAFVQPASDYADFADALRAKLLREVRGGWYGAGRLDAGDIHVAGRATAVR